MSFKNEKELLYLIRYALSFIIVILSIIVSISFYFENKKSFEELKKNSEEKIIQARKQLVKEQIDNVYDYIKVEQAETEDNLRTSLLNRIHEAHKIVSNIYEQYKDTHTKEQITQQVKTVLKDIRFNNDRGYFFIYDLDGTSVFHPIITSLEGTSILQYKDSRGNYIVKEAISGVQKKDLLYQEWYWKKTKDSKEDSKKIGFVKRVHKLDWVLGTGEYVDDFTKDVKKTVLKQINKFKLGNNRYIFTVDRDTTYLTSFNKDLIGKSVLAQKNTEHAKKILENMNKVSDNGGGFIEYLQIENPITKNPTVKISYVKKIPKWDWIIGSGFYIDEIEQSIAQEKEFLTQKYEKDLKIVMFFSLIGAILMLILTFYISKIIEKKFEEYKESINKHIEENEKQHELLAQKTKLSAMGEMMENIAHQWRQPLSLITTAASGVKLNKEFNLLTDEHLLSSLDNITNTANHLSQTIDDFRDFFRPDKEKLDFSLKLSIKKTLKLISSQLRNKEINIVENIEDINIKGFERELLQVSLNLLNNAKDALEDTKGERYIFIDIFKEKKNTVIQIKDNAGGIDKEIMPRIFEPYFTTKHKSQGTGIGLYMSQEIIVRHMNGSLSVENNSYLYNDKSYTGAVFTIILPMGENS